MSQGVQLRTATADDVDALAAIEAAAWPEALATPAVDVAARIEVFAMGQWLAVAQQRVVGVIYSQRLDREFFDAAEKSYEILTDAGRFSRTHSADGEIYQLIGVSVAPAARGQRIGRALVDQAVAHARTLAGVERIIGFTRPVDYHRHRDMAIDQYAALRDDSGRLVDPVLSFHVEGGAKIVSTHAAYRPADEQTCGYGVMIEYAVGG